MLITFVIFLLQRLSNPKQKFPSLESVGPGCGLPGALWSEIGLYATTGINAIGTHHHSAPEHLRKSSSTRASFGLGTQHADSHVVHWREVDELANDPDQPYDERLQHLAKAGFTCAAGIPFQVKNYRGMII